jgi:hypothetical protein
MFQLNANGNARHHGTSVYKKIPMFNIEKNISNYPSQLTLTKCEYFHGQLGLGKITRAFYNNIPESLGYLNLAM